MGGAVRRDGAAERERMDAVEARRRRGRGLAVEPAVDVEPQRVPVVGHGHVVPATRLDRGATEHRRIGPGREILEVGAEHVAPDPEGVVAVDVAAVALTQTLAGDGHHAQPAGAAGERRPRAIASDPCLDGESVQSQRRHELRARDVIDPVEGERTTRGSFLGARQRDAAGVGLVVHVGGRVGAGDERCNQPCDGDRSSPDHAALHSKPHAAA